MTDASITTILVAFFACLPPSLLAWATLRSSQKNAVKADALAVKADEIHTVSNGHLTAVTAALAIANEKIQGLEKLMGAMVTAKKEAQDAETKRGKP